MASSNSPLFRYETSILEFGKEIFAPSFPIQAGENYHTYPTEKPKYTVTNRNYGTAETPWRTEDIKQANRDTIYTFWETDLDKGYYDFTVIDHRKRMLFEASWNNWVETWSKRNGGVYTIDYNLESSLPWTPPVFGAYTMADDTLNNHTLDSYELTAQDGSITSSDILRSNGSGLKLTGDGSSTGLVGASGVVSWKRESKFNNLSLFCQFKLPLVKSGAVSLIEISSIGSHKYRINLEANSASDNKIYGNIQNAGSYTEIRKAVGSYHLCDTSTWYDVALTYDDGYQRAYLYIIESADTSFTDFLSGTSSEDEQIGEYNENAVLPPDTTWTACNLLKETTAVGLHNANDAFLQNAFIFDGFLSTIDFNMLRRLCYMWNNKTAVYPK